MILWCSPLCADACTLLSLLLLPDVCWSFSSSDLSPESLFTYTGREISVSAFISTLQFIPFTRKWANSKLVAARFGMKRSPPPGVLVGVVPFLVFASPLFPGVFVDTWTPEKLVLYDTDSTDRALPLRDASSFFFQRGAGPRVSPSMIRRFCISLTKWGFDIFIDNTVQIKVCSQLLLFFLKLLITHKSKFSFVEFLWSENCNGGFGNAEPSYENRAAIATRAGQCTLAGIYVVLTWSARVGDFLSKLDNCKQR